MEFGILGPLRAVGPDGPIELGAPKQRALLAMLLLAHREAAVSAERLTDALWGEEPPATAPKALQVYVSQLRRALGPGQPIVTRGAGYAIELEPGQLDLERFETLTDAARSARADGRLADAAATLRDALALFRGPPLADAPLLGPAASEAGRLAAVRLATLEERLELDLALGEHAAVAGELETLAAEHPYRERLHAQLMLALYRGGRQADALEAFRRVRHALVEELGLDPGRELQRLEAAILTQDPALDLAPAAAPAAVAPRRAEPARPPLPVAATPLLGRADDVATAIALLADPDVRLLTLTGPGGIGKTRLARELAERLEPRFEDGARFVALAAVADPERVVPAIAQALGALESEGQNPFEALVALLAERELLLVLDNLEQVLAAAPELGQAARRRPAGEAADHEPRGAAPGRASTSSRSLRSPRPRPRTCSCAVRARSTRGSRSARTSRRASSGSASASTGCRWRSSSLPRARRSSPPAAILERLERRLDLLSAGARDAPARQQTLRATIDWSYDLLDPPAQRLFAQLGVFVGGWTLEAAEAVCGPGALDGLEHARRTRASSPPPKVASGCSRPCASTPSSGSRRTAGSRRPGAPTRQAFAAFADEADLGMRSADAGAWLDRLHADRENVRAAIDFAVAGAIADTALALCDGGLALLGGPRATSPKAGRSRTPRWPSGEGTPREPLRRARRCGGAGRRAGRLRRGPHPLRGVAGDRARARRAGVASRARSPTSATSRSTRVTSSEAIRLYEESIALWREIGHDRGLSVITQNLGLAQSGAGRHERAAALLEESVVLARRAGDPAHLASTLRSLGRALLIGDRDRAEVLPIVQESLRALAAARRSPRAGGVPGDAGRRRRAAARGAADRRRRERARGRRARPPARRGAVGVRGQGAAARDARSRRASRPRRARARGSTCARRSRARPLSQNANDPHGAGRR